MHNRRLGPIEASVQGCLAVARLCLFPVPKGTSYTSHKAMSYVQVSLSALFSIHFFLRPLRRDGSLEWGQ